MMQYFDIFVFLILAVIVAVNATNYCDSKLCDEDQLHIACNNSGSYAYTCPHDATLVNFDDNLKNTVVNFHNEKRNFIAGGGDVDHNPACLMATMLWDDELAALAAYQVKQCYLIPYQCHNTKKFRYSGQNIAGVHFQGIPNYAALLKLVLDMWYSGVFDSNRKHIKSYQSFSQQPLLDTFTLMVADRNVRVGCAALTYSENRALYKTLLVACNYATKNVVGHPIYRSCKEPGIGCRKGINPEYPNLCSPEEKYNVNIFKYI